jgi:flagellar export protein FliJ
MKKFLFPLARVMHFRNMQARLEEIKLESLYAELRAIDARKTSLREEHDQSEKSLKSSAAVTGLELELHDSFLQSVKIESEKLDAARAACQQKIEAQMAVVTSKRRDVKLLEKLKEQRFEKWRAEMFKEIDQQAEEAYLAKWNKTAH